MDRFLSPGQFLLNYSFFWPPKARPLYFTTVIYLFFLFLFRQHRWKTSHGISSSQPNFASRSEVVVNLQMPPKILGHPPNLGRKNIKNFGPLFLRLPHSTPHIYGTKRRIDKQKCESRSTIYSVSSKSFCDPETAEIRLFVVTNHPSAAITLQPSKLRHMSSYF